MSMSLRFSLKSNGFWGSRSLAEEEEEARYYAMHGSTGVFFWALCVGGLQRRAARTSKCYCCCTCTDVNESKSLHESIELQD